MDPLPARRGVLLVLIVAAAWVVLTLLAFSALSSTDERARAMVVSDLQDQVAARLGDWERGLQRELDALVELARSTPDRDLPLLQAQQRRRAPWFDSLYAWAPTPPENAPVRGGNEPVFRFPTKRQAAEGTPACVVEHGEVEDDDVQAWAAALRRACEGATLRDRAEAATLAATKLRDAGALEGALTALQIPGILDSRALSMDLGDGLSLELRATRRLLLADLLTRSGMTSDGLNLASRTAREITELDAPNLEATLGLVSPVIDRLEAGARNNEVDYLRYRLGLAEQRLSAWRQVVIAAGRSGRDLASLSPKLTADPYSDPPFLLYVAWERGVALQVRQRPLLDDLLRGALGRFQGGIVIVDPSGRVVAGPRGGPEAAHTLAFPESTLSHLRVGVLPDLVEARSEPLRARYGINTILIAICAVLGLTALLALGRANRQHRELLRRQRAFTQRVTHELKTPLAGIKVMAENLALGAFRGEGQRVDMAQRIVDEADRLTDRVNEVLSFSARPRPPERVRFDIEEPIMEAIDHWGPRLEQVGARFTAELAPVDPIVGDPVALRDAVSCLLDNALKYRREDLTPRVHLEVREHNGRILIEVIDNGMGVPKAERTAIFERFVRVEGPNRGKSGGHGLGLSQVRDIARFHGGAARCEDGFDGGARFIIDLPASG